MKPQIKNIIVKIVPPILIDAYRNISANLRHAEKPSTTGYVGNYTSWAEARKASGGYESEDILNKVKDALLKVKNGEAVYERDSVLFDQVQYSWPLLTGLLWIASRENNKLNLIDFGGSLGSTYFQNRLLLSHLRELQWSIVEQEKFVECGRRFFKDEHLNFYSNIDECLGEQRPDAILLSSVIQYLEKPYSLLNEIIGKKFKYMVFDRTPYLLEGDDRITVQIVPAEIYQASYPGWFFNQDKFMNFITESYDLLFEFESIGSANIPSVFKGFVFKIKI